MLTPPTNIVQTYRTPTKEERLKYKKKKSGINFFP